MSAVAAICWRCGRTFPKGTRCPCDSERERARRRVMARIQGRGTDHWQRVRRERLEIDAHHCQLRLSGCRGAATTVHLDPRLAGDHRMASVEHTLSACAVCHGRVDGGRRGRAPFFYLQPLQPPAQGASTEPGFRGVFQGFDFS